MYLFVFFFFFMFFFFQAEDGIRDLVRSRGLGDVYKRQFVNSARFAGASRKLIWSAGSAAKALFTGAKTVIGPVA